MTHCTALASHGTRVLGVGVVIRGTPSTLVPRTTLVQLALLRSSFFVRLVRQPGYNLSPQMGPTLGSTPFIMHCSIYRLVLCVRDPVSAESHPMLPSDPA